jgi:thymidylate synthase (FAD)
MEEGMSIRIITEPTIYVLGRQVIDLEGVREWGRIHGTEDWQTDAPSGAETLCEIAGRSCYGEGSFQKPRPGGNVAYLNRIISEGHGRVLEHAVWTIGIAGVSRSLAQELYTHTVGFSKSMRSQRYIDEGDCGLVMPPALVGCLDTEAGGIWLSACSWSVDRYRLLARQMEGKAEFAELEPTARRKRAREAARSVLPNSVETRIVLTGNGRAFRNLLESRGTPAVDAEFRRLCCVLLPVLKEEAPNIFADMEAADGCITSKYRKV